MSTTLPDDLLSTTGLDRLHVGGKEVKAGWQILNALDLPGVDFVGDLRDLSHFADQSFDMVYGSHILEHLGYQQDLTQAIRGVHRILREGGKFFVSVPDLDVLCRLFVHEKLGMVERFQVMRMMFGGQTDAYDFHQVGLNGEFLIHYLREGGFRAAYRVREFGIFNDTSKMCFQGVPISVNMVAYKQ